MERLLCYLTPKMSLRASLSEKRTLKARLSVPKSLGFQDNYEKLKNLPQIEKVSLTGNKSFSDLGLEEVTNQDILDMFK